MAQEDKQLLLTDLCGRLPYGVIVNPVDCGKAKLIGFKGDCPILFDLVLQREYCKPWEIEYIKPYLRPMSSMTDEEKSQYNFYLTRIVFGYDASLLIDWLNKKMFDYRGLIPMGLAESTEKFNPYN